MRISAPLLVAMIAATAATAEEMETLETVLSGQPEASYQHVRCAAFYLADIEWGGQALDERTFNDSKSVISALMLVATLQRSAKMGGEVEHLATTVNADTRAVADLYLGGYRQSYAMRGTAWEGNPLWESDAQTCAPIGEVALSAVAQLEQSSKQ